MKTKLYRVLVMLLAIAMMIPSFAMAEGETTPTPEPKIEVVGKIEQKLLKDDIDDWTSVSVSYSNIPADALSPEIWWESSDSKVVQVANKVQGIGAGTNVTSMYVQLKGTGTATVKGTLHLNNAATAKTAEFSVKLEAVDVTEIKFSKDMPTQYNYFKDGDEYLNSISLLQYVSVTAAEGSTYYKNINDVRYRITSGDDVATVQNPYGYLTFHKAGTVTVEAYIPGSAKTASATLTIIDKEKPDPTAPEANGYTDLQFTAQDKKIYTITDATLNLGGEGKVFVGVDEYWDPIYTTIPFFLTKTPVDATDTLIWTVDNLSIATVSDQGVVNFGNNYGKVKVTVTSTVNKTTTAECYVERIKKEDLQKPYTKLAFSPAEIKLRKQKFDATKYLTVKEPFNAVDSLVWESSDNSVATVDEDGKVTVLKDEGEVTITARSQKAPTVKTEPGLKITFVKAANVEYKSIEFVGDKKIPVKKAVEQEIRFDLKNNYLKVDPENPSDDTLSFTSSDDDIATVDKVTGKLTVVAKKSGTAKITVENKKGTLSDVLTVDVTVVTDPYTTLEFKKSLDHKKTLKMTKGMTPVDLSVDLNTEGGSDDEQRWTSNDETVAKVTNRGLVTLVGEGTAKITVRNYDGTKTDYIDLTVEEVKNPYTKLAFIPAEPLTKKLSEESVNLEKKFLYTETKKAGESDDELNWIVDDRTVATVKDGVVTFKSAGTVKVTVFNADKSASAEITITIVKDEKVIKTITPAAESIKVVVGDNIDLNDYVTIDPAEYEDELVWTSSNQQIVKFPNYIEGLGSVDGVAKPIAKGEVTVTVYSKLNPENKKTFKLVVTDKEGKVESLKILEGNDQFTLKTGEGDIYLSRYVLVTPVDALDKATYDEAADELVFTSDDTDILTVDKDTGLVHLNGKPGTAKITVRSKKNPEAQAQFTITHAKAELKSMKFVDAPKTLSRTGSVDLKNYLVTDPWYYTDKTYATTDLYWESSDPQIATALNGVLTWKGVGKVTITVTEINSKKTATHEIELTDPSAVQEIILKDITLTAGDNVKLTDFMTINPLDAVYENVKFTSSDRNVAEILKKKTDPDDEDGREGYQQYYLGAYRGGESTITVYVENYDKSVKTATCKVTVIGNNDVEDVKIAKNKYALKLNTKTSVVVRFNAEPYNCDIDEDDIYVVSSNSAIADTDDITVDSKGRKGHFTVYAKKPGTVWFTIKRTKDDKELDACKIIISAVRVKSVKWEKDAVKLYWYNDGITDYYDGTQSNTVYKNYVDIKPIINPANAYCNVTFETTDPGVAFVDSKSIKGFQNALASGSSLSDVKITAVGPGKCKIIMKVDDGKKVRKATLNVEVETKQPKLKISQRKATLKLEKGSDILYLRAFDAYTDKDIEVKWTSSDTSVAKVNVDGKVRAVGAGKATITATTKNGQKQVVKCKITVKAPSTENVAAKKITGDTKVTVKAGEKKALEIKVKPEGAKVTFTSSDSKIVKVTKDGTIKGIKAGKATITVKAAEGKAELKIKVVVK